MRLKLFIAFILSLVIYFFFNFQVSAQEIGGSCSTEGAGNDFCGYSGCYSGERLVCVREGGRLVLRCRAFAQCTSLPNCEALTTINFNQCTAYGASLIGSIPCRIINGISSELIRCCPTSQTKVWTGSRYCCSGSCYASSTPIPTSNPGQSGCGLCPTNKLSQCGASLQPEQCYWNANTQTCSFSSSCGGGGYQPACAWTDNRPSCLGDGSSASNCRTQLGSNDSRCRCCPGLSEGSNGACGCPVTAPLPVCNQIQKDTSSPVVGSRVIFTCSASTDAQTYEFRYRKQCSSTNLLCRRGRIQWDSWTNLGTQVRNVSRTLTINQSGKWQVQCRACKVVRGVTFCSAWQ